jgi:hypothetical protein
MKIGSDNFNLPHPDVRRKVGIECGTPCVRGAHLMDISMDNLP